MRARSEGLTAADVDRALTEDRSLVVTWLNRCTLHLVRSEDFWWLHALTAPQHLGANTRRLAQLGVEAGDADRAVVVIQRALAEAGPLTNLALRERLRAAGVVTEGQALIHLLGRAALCGVTVRGPMLDRRQAYVLTRDWVGRPLPVDRGHALVELVRRYLAGHGPAADTDLARWAGLPLRDVRAGLRDAAPAIVELPGGLVDLAGRAPAAPLPPPRLLGAFEPLLCGWPEREPLLGAHRRRIIQGGMFAPFALVRGRAAATWVYRGGEVRVTPLDELSPADAAALDADAGAVVRFLGGGPAPPPEA